MKKKKLFFVGALALLGLAACSEKDLYDEEQIAANEAAQKKAQTEANMEAFKVKFEQKYGKVDANQSWDFSNTGKQFVTRAGDEIETTLVEGLDFGIKDERVSNNSNVLTTRTITKNVELFNYISNGELKDGKHHEGEAVVLLAPSSDFTIYPLCMQGGWTHTMYVKVGDNEPVKVYDKTWTTFGRHTVNGDAIALERRGGNYYVSERAVLPGIHIKAPIGTRVDIYITDINGNQNETAGTINGRAIYLDCDVKPEGVEMVDDAVIKYIGIEDNPNGDSDYNDVVLAVVGNPFVPEKIVFTNDTYDLPLTITKRYMTEDLGTADDFDFNDVVVDVTETAVEHHKVTLANGKVTKDEITSTDVEQKAVVKHLGGTLPFLLTIGNTTLPEMGGMETFQTDPNQEYDITGWIPAANNVTVTVNQVPIHFPNNGEVPMIFACDPSENWAAEREYVNFKEMFKDKVKVEWHD